MFKSKIRALRKISNMSQQQVADLLGVERSTYSGYESGKSRPSAQKTKNLARIFRATVDSLLDDTLPVELLEDEENLQVSEKPMKYEGANPIELTLANLTRQEQMLIGNFRMMNAIDKQDLLFESEEKSDKMRF